MKSSSRRLGRGLGAFLDFGPADADGEAKVDGVIAAETKSILQTSEPRPPVETPKLERPTPSAPARPVPAQAATAAVPAAAVQPVPKPVVAPASAEAPAGRPAPAAPTVPAAAPPPKPADDALFVDDVVEGLAFPDVELE